MTTFQSDRYQWRETYFVLFPSAKRPKLAQVEARLRRLDSHYQIADAQADGEGRFESLTLTSPDDFAALDISYLAGEEVVEQGTTLAAEAAGSEGIDAARLAKLRRCDARFDVMHFEQLTDAAPEDESEDMLDPSALLVVLDALIELTGGIGVDPQAGSLM